MKIVKHIPYLAPARKATRAAKIASGEISRNFIIQAHLVAAVLVLCACWTAQLAGDGDAGVATVLIVATFAFLGLCWIAGWRSESAKISRAFAFASALSSTIYLGGVL